MRTKRYFYVVEFVVDGVTCHIENPYLYNNESEAYEWMGRCISDEVKSHPGVVVTIARVNWKWEKV